jgi:hypothetical protein
MLSQPTEGKYIEKSFTEVRVRPLGEFETIGRAAIAGFQSCHPDLRQVRLSPCAKATTSR